MSALIDCDSQVKAFDIGALNYISKPVMPQVVLSQIKQILKISPNVKHYKIGKYNIKIHLQIVSIEGTDLKLRHKDVQVLSLLLDSSNKLVERGFILKQVWRHDSVSNQNSLNSTISRIKKSIDKYSGMTVETIYATGYILKYTSE